MRRKSPKDSRRKNTRRTRSILSRSRSHRFLNDFHRTLSLSLSQKSLRTTLVVKLDQMAQRVVHITSNTLMPHHHAPPLHSWETCNANLVFSGAHHPASDVWLRVRHSSKRRTPTNPTQRTTLPLSTRTTIFFFWDEVQGCRVNKVSTGTCEVLRGGLQDFPSPSTPRRASPSLLPPRKNTKASVTVVRGVKKGS